MGRTIAIGDIHGCSDALRAVLDAISPVEGDRIVTLGDYVDRGPDSKGVIDILLGLESAGQLAPILGNHEEMMVAAIRGSAPVGWWLQHGGADTLKSYGSQGDPDSFPPQHFAFFDRCQPLIEGETYFCTHANYDPALPLDAQPHEALRWKALVEPYPAPHSSGKRAIVGHTAQKSGLILDAGHVVCIDTHCHGGGWLTALDLDSGETWQADKSGRLFTG